MENKREEESKQICLTVRVVSEICGVVFCLSCLSAANDLSALAQKMLTSRKQTVNRVQSVECKWLRCLCMVYQLGKLVWNTDNLRELLPSNGQQATKCG